VNDRLWQKVSALQQLASYLWFKRRGKSVDLMPGFDP
jgi:hypothetical protein